MKFLNKQLTAIVCVLIFSIGLMLSSNVLAGKPANKTYVPQVVFDTAVTDLQRQINEISSPQLYEVGDTGPGGGWVFFVDENGLHGLEAAPEDQSSNVAWFIQWGDSFITNAIRNGIYSGQFNTERIIIYEGELRNDYAARLCANYQGGGYGDWYLPSKDELNLMWENLADSDGGGTNSGPGDLGNLGGFSDDDYWSSTEDNEAIFSSPWLQDFSDGTQVAVDAGVETSRVRAVRAF